MPVWKVVSPEIEPKTHLYNWFIIKLKGKRVVDGPEEVSYHFCGNTGDSGRISTEIQSFDKETMSGKTKSGRIYVLDGISQMDNNGLFIYQRAMEGWRIPVGGHTTLYDVEELCRSLQKDS